MRAHKYDPRGLNGAELRKQTIEGTHIEMDVGAPPVMLRRRTTDKAGLLEHLQVMREQIARNAKVASQCRRREILLLQCVDDSETGRVCERRENTNPLCATHRHDLPI